MKYKITGMSAEKFAKRVFYMAWKACGGPFGMGIFQDRGSNVSEDEVVACAIRADDYGGASCKQSKGGEIDGDYVMGRMMRTHIKFGGAVDAATPKYGDVIGEDEVDVRPDSPRPDYQGWARKYATVQDLARAAAFSFSEDHISVVVDIVPKEVTVGDLSAKVGK